MDTSNCSNGAFTDNAFKRSSTSCDNSISLFIGLCSAIFVLRFLGFVFRACGVYIRSQKTDNFNARKKPFPAGAVIDLMTSIGYLILFLLVGFNIASYSNGLSLALCSVSFSFFAIGYWLFLLRMVRLGSRLTPFLKRTPSMQSEFLSRFSNVGRFLGGLQLLSLFLSGLCMMILAPLISSHGHVLNQVGFAFSGIFVLLGGLGMVYQIERVISVIHSVSRGVEEIKGTDSNDVGKALHKLRYTQLLVVFIAFPICLQFFCLAGNAMEWHWYWVIVVTIGGETLGNLAIVFPCTKRKRSNSKNTGSSTQKTQKNAIVAIDGQSSVKSSLGNDGTALTQVQSYFEPTGLGRTLDEKDMTQTV